MGVTQVFVLWSKKPARAEASAGSNSAPAITAIIAYKKVFIFSPISAQPTIGALQIEVMAERMVNEYGLDVLFEVAPYNVARWIHCDDDGLLSAFLDKNKSASGTDLDDAPVYLAKNAWDVGYAQEKNPEIRFTATKERSN